MKISLLLPLILILSATTVLAKPQVQKQAVCEQKGVGEAALVDFLMTNQKQLPEAAARKDVLQRELSVQKAILAEANKQGLAATTAVKMKQELARRQVLVDVYWLEFFRKNPVAETRLQAAYDKLKSAAGARQFHLSQLVVKDEAVASKAIHALKQNNNFAEVAKSFAPAGAKQEIDLGWRWRIAFVPPIAQAIDSLKPGEYTAQPIRIPSGFAIVKLEEVRNQEFPAFEAIKPQVENQERQRMQAEEVKRLRSLP